MHAVVIDVTINDMPAAQRELEGLVPQVSAAHGFLAAYWIAFPDGKGTSIAIFDSEEAAHGLAGMASGGTDAVTMARTEIGQVVAHA